MAELDNLIDSKISLISHQDVRYDGTLFSINTAESSIVLKDVKCLGTEGRVTDESKKVAASNAVIPFVTFPGQEIKDLYVHEGTEAAPAAPAPKKQDNNRQNNNNNRAVPPKPPVMAHTGQPHRRNENRNNNVNSNNNNDKRPQQQKQQQQQQHSAPKQQQQQHNDKPREPRPQSNIGTGAHLLHMKEKKGSDAGPSSSTVNEGVFDFAAGLSVFKKDEVLAKVANEEEAAKAAKYKKDDFFDSLSTDRTSREEGVPTRMTASQERSLNQDTFGAIALQGNSGYRRHYGGRGGQGRGGGRGRGRGYYNRNNNNNAAN